MIGIEQLSEMLKGILEGIVMELIDREEIYGYEIVRKLHALGFEGIVEGSVYTILTRLERNRMVDITKKPSELGPPRKFYRLNPTGRQELALFWKKWAFLSGVLNNLKEESGG